MARIDIALPEHFSFLTEITVLSLHINYAAHLDNALLLSLVNDARMRYWHALGYGMQDIEGILPIVGDAALQYKSEAFLGEVMVVELAARDFHKYGFDLVWRMREKTTAREVARGKTGILCLDVATRKLTAIPQKFFASLGG